MSTLVVRCKHCNRPITRDVPSAAREWIHEKSKNVPVMYFSCSMYSRTKSKREIHPPYAEPKELNNGTIKS